jgi:BirA family biotin operon repressor/biotin-[acetyl-CoA-carboxylase] ligase
MDGSFLRSIVRVEEVDSTGDLARRRVERGDLPAPALVWADRQTRGRGQRSNVWWSDSGSLTVTLVLDPSSLGLTPEQEPRVALTTAVAIIEAIEALYPDCRPGIRWPNDVEVGGKKLGGILPERVEAPEGPRLLIGIGLNVRTRLEFAPVEVRRMAATLGDWDEANPSNDPKAELLWAILDRLGDRLRDLAESRSELVERWNQLDALAGSTVRVEVGSEFIEAIAAGIDESGGLRIIDRGRTRIIHAGRVLRD